MPCPIRRKFRFITTVMMALPFWLFGYIQQATSWTIQSSVTRKSFVRMDTELPPAPFATAWKTKFPTKAFMPPTTATIVNRNNRNHEPSSSSSNNVRMTKHGMPWKQSIDERKPNSDCTFMPFWEHQLEYFGKHLSNFTIDDDHFVMSEQNNVRMVTLSCSSEEYRLIRMTYLDGGNQTQIFTSVAYPRANLPILGCDFLSFQGGKRVLSIVDYHPIHDLEVEHDTTYEHLLEPIRNSYETLQEPMSCRFFDPSQFFSSQTLLGKFDQTTQKQIWSDVMPAWQQYMQTHIGLTKQPKAFMNVDKFDPTRYHAAYDTYCLSHDPAHPMFNKLFGPDFADDFLYNTMFPLAERPQNEDEAGAFE